MFQSADMNHLIPVFARASHSTIFGGCWSYLVIQFVIMLKIIDNTFSGFQIQNMDGIVKIPALENWSWGQSHKVVELDVVRDKLWLVTYDQNGDKVVSERVAQGGFFADYNGENIQSMDERIDDAKLLAGGLLIESPCGNEQFILMKEELLLSADKLGNVRLNTVWSQFYPRELGQNSGWTISGVNLDKTQLIDYIKSS